MYTLMRDPVTLPSSKAVVDRSTIKSHLLSDSKDPFNRVPLTLEDVIPSASLVLPKSGHDCGLTVRPIVDMELKQRIDAFLAERRNKNTALDRPPEEVHMDVSED